MATLSHCAYTVQYHGTNCRWCYHVDGIQITLPEAVLLTRRLERDGYGARLFPSTFTPPDKIANPRAPRHGDVVNVPEVWTVDEILAREG